MLRFTQGALQAPNSVTNPPGYGAEQRSNDLEYSAPPTARATKFNARESTFHEGLAPRKLTGLRLVARDRAP